MGPRILINALSARLGGGRTYVLNLLRELGRDTRGYRFAMLASPGEFRPEEAGPVELITPRLPSASSPLRLPARVLYEELRLPLLARRFDLVYCLADLAPGYSPVPVVVLLRNLNIYDRRFYDTPRLRLLEQLVRLGLRSADRAIFPSAAAAALIASRLRIPSERLRVVPFGIGVEAFASAQPAEAVPLPYVFVPAALERHKNFEIVVEGFRRLRDPGAQLWIAGHDSEDPGYAQRVRDRVRELGLEPRVRFLGAVPYGEMLGYYRGARAVLLPSTIETFGHPVLEAMLAGAPVVASDIPAFRELAGEAALYFDPTDAEELAQTLDRVFEEPEATAERVAAGRERVQQFSWKSSVDRLCAVFDELLGGSPPPVELESA